jgi:hypothetical protein
MVGYVESRLPPSVRRNRALMLAAEELGGGELDEIVALASTICNMRIWPDEALDYFRAEEGHFEVHTSLGIPQVRLKPKDPDE